MSDILSTLHPVVAPDLTEVSYGENVRQQFENINSNFQKLGNRDFVKGEKGADLGLEQIVLIGDGLVLTELGAAVFNALLNTDKIKAGWLLNSDEFREEFNSGTLKPILDTNWYDYFITNGEPNPETSYVSIFYREVNQLLKSSKKEYIGSPIPLVFIDARFTSDVIQSVKSTNNSYDIYLDIVDKSCALYIKYDDGWKVEKVNQFPTLYYEDSMFKWKLSNKKSGIRAQGIQGLDGKPGRIWIGLADAKNVKDVDLLNVNSAYVPIEYVMSFYNLTEEDSSGKRTTWITPEEATETKHGGLSIGDTIIMIPKIDITNRLGQSDSIGQNMLLEAASANNQIWISIVQKDSKGQFITYFSNENLINVSVGNTWMRETMMKVGDDNFKVAKGLFLRLKPNGDENELRAHLLYATGEGTSTNLHLRPVENLDNVNSKSLNNCSVSIEDYKNINVKATSILDLLGDTVNITANKNKVNITGDATIKNDLLLKNTKDKPFNIIETTSNDADKRGLLIRNYDKIGSSGAAAINIWTETTTETNESNEIVKRSTNHYVDICGSGDKNNRGSINMWGDGYLDNKGHYSIGPTGSFVSNNDPDVSILKSGQLQANKGLTVKKGADIKNGLNVSSGAKISDFIEISSNYSPRIDFKHSSSNVTACIKEDPEQTIKISKNLQVEENTIVKDLEIHPTGVAPIYINSQSSGGIVEAITKNWKGGGDGSLETTFKENNQSKTGSLNLMKFYSGYIDAINDKIKIVVNPISTTINYGSYFKTTHATIIKEVYFKNIQLLLQLYSPSTGYITLYNSSENSILSQTWYKEDINPSDGWMKADSQYTFTIPKIEKSISNIKIGEKLQVYLSITMNNPSCKYTGSASHVYEDSNKRFINVTGLPTVKITQNRIKEYSDPKAVMSGNLIMLGVNKHRTIGLYVDSRSDDEFMNADDVKDTTKNLNDTCGVFFTYTDKNGKSRIKVLSIRTLYNQIFGKDLSEIEEGGEISEEAITYISNTSNNTVSIKNIVDENYEEVSKMQ